MSLSSKQHINLKLDAHSVALDVDRDKEEFYRQAAVLLNKRYEFYRNHYKDASVEQLWLYVALDMAVNLCSDVRDKNLEPVAKQLSELNDVLRSVLNEETTNTLNI